ncbi:hypothetical protein QNI19_24785 [Cytophagaceae bacterium DM2B3-1]|uniref:VCBS repeat-containing protein n=1 Tax=Xanthocytophaga flava TaxID=3048013 RepID=A0ABT7CT87_9BACT|nr:hypothetical protein [Xanthocytophaga flavus]MDJ1496177.1 hypothetical protein [Xanthocytophaga flavus]
MKYCYLILVTLFLIACHTDSDKNTNEKPQDSTVLQNQFTNTIAEPKEEIIVDTLNINRQKLIKYSFPNNRFFGLTTLKGDTLIKFGKDYFYADILDINGDGNKDIRIFGFTNVPNVCETYLFDEKTKKYSFLENCDLDIQQIKNTPYFYSYARAGCADYNWESYLSKIVDFKLIDIGFIDGRGCEYENPKESPRQIKIYKIKDKGHILYKTLPYSKHIPTFSDKWDFIKKYWTKNHRQFIH